MEKNKMAGIRKLLVKMPKMRIKMARSVLILILITFSFSKEDNCICEGKESIEIYNERDYDACYRLSNYSVRC